ncbi:MAG TPA: hypothetical protein VIO59_00465 [Rhodanobacter sp.]
MSRPRSIHRCLTALFVVMSLLLSQLALASYVCPGESNLAAMAEMAAAGEPCEGMDPAQPLLCYQYATDMSLSVEPMKAGTLLPPAVVQTVILSLLLPVQAREVPVQAVPERQHYPPERVFLATRRLRI